MTEDIGRLGERAEPEQEPGGAGEGSGDAGAIGDPILGVALEGLRRAEQTAKREHSIAETLQRSLLLEEMPSIPGLGIAASYVAGAAGTQVGGDWYDVIQLRGGRIGIAIGDVVGHGVAAAARMGHLQSALRAYAFEGHGPAELMERMNHFARDSGTGGMATLLFAVISPEDGIIRLASAGHPPPLLLGPDGEPGYLELVPGNPLGVVHLPLYEESMVALEPSSTVLLYSDGLVEQPGLPLDHGLDALSEAVRGGSREPEALCRSALDSMLHGREPRDDVAVLALQLEPVDPARFELELPAVAESLSPMRHALARWIRAGGATEEEVYETLVACGEACANAIAHAYTPGDERFTVTARRGDGGIEIAVHDEGNWREARRPEGGRGLSLMRELMDAVEVEREERGTTIRLRRRLGADGRP